MRIDGGLVARAGRRQARTGVADWQRGGRMHVSGSPDVGTMTYVGVVRTVQFLYHMAKFAADTVTVPLGTIRRGAGQPVETLQMTIFSFFIRSRPSLYRFSALSSPSYLNPPRDAHYLTHSYNLTCG